MSRNEILNATMKDVTAFVDRCLSSQQGLATPQSTSSSDRNVGASSGESFNSRPHSISNSPTLSSLSPLHGSTDGLTQTTEHVPKTSSELLAVQCATPSRSLYATAPLPQQLTVPSPADNSAMKQPSHKSPLANVSPSSRTTHAIQSPSSSAVKASDRHSKRLPTPGAREHFGTGVKREGRSRSSSSSKAPKSFPSPTRPFE